MMRKELYGGALGLLLIGCAGFAGAQNSPNGAQGSRQEQNAPSATPGAGQEQQPLNLNQSQGQMVSEGLSGEAAQSAPGYQGQVGSKPPDSAAAKPLPNNVTEQVPRIRAYLFVKLPDRILLIDPRTRLVAEIVRADATTGRGSGGPSGPGGSAPNGGSSPSSEPR